MLTIIIPVWEKNQEVIKRFLKAHISLFNKYNVIVIDRGGGELLKDFATYYEKSDEEFWVARKRALMMVKTKYVLNLDSDTILPKKYVSIALKLFEMIKNVAVIALDYEETQGHLAYGTSIWKTKILKKLYDWRKNPTEECECIYMWKKVRQAEMKIETLPYKAKHLKGI